MANVLLLKSKLDQQQAKLDKLEASRATEHEPRMLASIDSGIRRAKAQIESLNEQIEIHSKNFQLKATSKIPAMEDKAKFLRQKALIYITQADSIEREVQQLKQTC